jgi:hypothetical protein
MPYKTDRLACGKRTQTNNNINFFQINSTTWDEQAKCVATSKRTVPLLTCGHSTTTAQRQQRTTEPAKRHTPRRTHAHKHHK